MKLCIRLEDDFSPGAGAREQAVRDQLRPSEKWGVGYVLPNKFTPRRKTDPMLLQTAKDMYSHCGRRASRR